MNNNSEQIGRYLQNEMSAEERTAFEKQLATDKNLQQELSIQKQIIAAVERAGLKNIFGKAIHRKFIATQLIRWGIVAAIITGLIFYALKTDMFSHPEGEGVGAIINKDAETFIINNSADTIIETDEGVVFGIPANAFNSKSKKIRVEIKTAISPYKIMQQGLSTTSNGALLQTAGMFYINGYDKEKPVSLVKKIDVSVPAENIDPKMQLFSGVQDSSGRINWVNPEPIEKRLRTYDITSLDFYPPYYLPVLKALGKDYTNKKYTDSLYYSFSGYRYGVRGDFYKERLTQDSAGEIIFSKYVKDELAKDYTKPDTAKKRLTDTSATERYSDYPDMNSEIDPARIKAIWDKKFNNTIIATKEFEERLQYMHSICQPLFLVYLENLNKPLYQIDQFIADNWGPRYVAHRGEQYGLQHKFSEFASRRDGGVILKEGMQEKLSAYFEKKYKAYQEAATKTWAKHEETLNRLAAIADDKRRTQETKDFLRDSKILREEFCINLTDAYRQVGIKRTCQDTIPQPPPAFFYNIQIDTVGWKNLDMYVEEATDARETMTFTDPETGKTVTLTYKEVSITIENQSQYDKVFVYLLPDGLNSFQRIEQKDKVFKENLNMLLKYDAVAIAYKGGQSYFYKQDKLQPGQYTFRLSAITEKELKLQFKKYSQNKSEEMLNEYEYRLFEQQEIKREVQLRKERDFRDQIMTAIWSCSEGRFPEIENNMAFPVAEPDFLGLGQQPK